MYLGRLPYRTRDRFTGTGTGSGIGIHLYTALQTPASGDQAQRYAMPACHTCTIDLYHTCYVPTTPHLLVYLQPYINQYVVGIAYK